MCIVKKKTHPDRNNVVIVMKHLIAEIHDFLLGNIVITVTNYPVNLRVQSGRDRMVIRKGLCGEDIKQIFSIAALFAKPAHVGGQAPVEIVESEGVIGDYDQYRMLRHRTDQTN